MLVDTNVVLDLMLRREPWLTAARLLIEARDAGLVTGYLPASVLTDIFYISRRLVGIERVFNVLDQCIQDFVLVPVDGRGIASARRLPGNDFEDNVQSACAQAMGLALIVTRDPVGFAHSPIKAVAPADVMQYLPTP